MEFNDRRPKPKHARPRDIGKLQTHLEENHGASDLREHLVAHFEGQDPDDAAVAKAIRRMHNEEHWQPDLSDHVH